LLSLTDVFVSKTGNHNFPILSTCRIHLPRLGEMQTIVSQNSATPHVEVDLTFRRTITIASSGRKRGGMGKVVGFVGAKCGTCGVWCQGSPTCLLQKNLESRKDESKTVNWNFLQLRTGGVTYETSEVVRKKTKHTVIKRVEFDPSSV